MILSNYNFSTNLEYFRAFGILHDGTKTLLSGLGQELKEVYERENLATHLGTFTPRMIKGHTKRQDFSLATPPCHWATQNDEECYIHFLRLVAYAIDARYQRLVQECVKEFIVDDKPFGHNGIKSIKGFVRMRNKLAADHRYDPKPRPAQNVDINRCLVAVEHWQNMLEVMKALLGEFGPFAKFKNQMSLPVEEAEKFFHLRLMMVSVQYDTGMTFKELCSNPQVQKLWEEYAQMTPPEGTVGGPIWDRQIKAALEWLRSPELADRKVVLMCEVQCVLAQYRDVRLKMHEIYKVHRADNGDALYTDFREIRTKMERQKLFDKDGSTPHRKECRDNTPSDGLKDTDDLLECLSVACRHGSIDALKSLMLATNVDKAMRGNSYKLFRDCIQSRNHRHCLPIAQLLITHKADLTATDPSTGATILYISSQEGHSDVARLLLDNKADANQADTNGVMPVEMASSCDHYSIVRLLVSAKGDITANAIEWAQNEKMKSFLKSHQQ